MNLFIWCVSLGPEWMSFDWISDLRLSSNELFWDPEKNEVTENLLLFDPSPLMGVVITVGGCSEQECIMSLSVADRPSRSVFNQGRFLLPRMKNR